jgi:hypothetical protein
MKKSMQPPWLARWILCGPFSNMQVAPIQISCMLWRSARAGADSLRTGTIISTTVTINCGPACRTWCNTFAGAIEAPPLNENHAAQRGPAQVDFLRSPLEHPTLRHLNFMLA